MPRPLDKHALRLVCRELRMRQRDLLSKSHRQKLVDARKEVMWRLDQAGYLHREIADFLQLSRGTVSYHIGQCRRRKRTSNTTHTS